MFNVIPVRIDGPFVEFLTPRPIAGAAGSHDETILRITFSNHWAQYTKQIEFFDALGETPVIRLLTADLLSDDSGDSYDVPIPGEAKHIDGDIRFTVKGTLTDGDTETETALSSDGVLYVLPGLWDPDAEESQDVTASQAAQLQSQLDEIKPQIIDAAKAADAKEAAEAASADALGYSTAAAESAVSARQDANRVSGIVTRAETAAASAEDSAESAEADRSAAEAAADRAEAATVHAPYIGSNGHWWVWDQSAGAYTDSGVSAASDYNSLDHKPSINGVTLTGDLSFDALGETTITNTELADIVRQQYNIVFGGEANG